MFVGLGAPSLNSSCLRRIRIRSDIDNKNKALCVALAGLALCFRVGLQRFRSYGAIDAIGRALDNGDLGGVYYFLFNSGVSRKILSRRGK